MSKIAAIACAALLCGCTSISPVTQLRDGTYLLTESNSGGFFRTRSSMIENATEEAEAFCERKHGVAQLDHATGAVGGPVQGTIAFHCVPDETH